jgi:hypothetical protein
MNEEFLTGVPVIGRPAPPEHLIVPPEKPAMPVQEAPANPAQAGAVDAVFSEEREQQLVAGLLGLWTSSLLLSDLAKEHFHVPVDEELEQPRPRDPSNHPQEDD